MSLKHALSGLLGIPLLMGCQHQNAPAPAVLADSSEDAQTAFVDALAAALDRPSIQLGAGDVTTSSTFTIAPPPLGPNETRSVATPTRYELMIIEGNCYVMEAGTETMIPLEGIRCRAL